MNKKSLVAGFIVIGILVVLFFVIFGANLKYTGKYVDPTDPFSYIDVQVFGTFRIVSNQYNASGTYKVSGKDTIEIKFTMQGQPVTARLIVQNNRIEIPEIQMVFIKK